MKRFIEEAVRWLAAGWNRVGTLDTTPRVADEPESERRLRAMLESGRTLLLP
jgi:hypothetical protein